MWCSGEMGSFDRYSDVARDRFCRFAGQQEAFDLTLAFPDPFPQPNKCAIALSLYCRNGNGPEQPRAK